MITVLLFAAALRIAASTGPLWLDEIWSLELATQAKSSAAILTDLRTDNNHVLNTLYLRAVGPGRSSLVYRLPAIACGTGSVLLGAVIAARWGQAAATIAATLLASSYLLVHYSSEARGYAPAIFFALLGCESLLRYVSKTSWQSAVVFWGSCVFGLLSHPIFTHFFVAAACWSMTVPASRSANFSLGAVIRHGAVLFGIPTVFAVVVYCTMWRNLDLGGGPAYSLLEVLTSTASLALGGPAGGPGALLIAAISVAVFGTACWSLREDRLHAGLLLLLLVLTPVVLAVAVRPPFLFPRYFLIAILGAPFCLSVVFTNLFRKPGLARWVAAILFVSCMAANLLPTIRLATVGRGQCRAALNHMAHADKKCPSEILISSDHNFGFRKLIDFHSRELHPPCPIHYVNGDQWPPQGPDWLVLHRTTESAVTVPATVLEIDSHRFKLDRVFDCAILSGWQWWCYRRLK